MMDWPRSDLAMAAAELAPTELVIVKVELGSLGCSFRFV
jgi:hypothetical protein